jgi:hypothetical protein
VSLAGVVLGMARKPTAADRPQFRRDVAKMIGELGVKSAEVSPDMVILVTRASDFEPESNVLWELEANKSSVRSDVVCSTCKNTVAMSNDAYGKYSAFDRKPRICCTVCLPSLMGS